MKVTTDSCLFGAWVAEELMNERSQKLLDIGAGTGLLSLMIIQKNPVLNIDAIEIDRAAASQARQNINASPWSGKINVLNTDAREYDPGEKYNFIVSNPPFYESELKGPDATKNIAHHEGLSLRELISVMKKLLKPGGKFFLLLPYKRNNEIKRLFLHTDCATSKLVMVRQTPHHDYFRLMIKGDCDNSRLRETEIEEITIKDIKDSYTPEFSMLLKDYYLGL